jgi:uncharacterized protein with PIN domain
MLQFKFVLGFLFGFFALALRISAQDLMVLSRVQDVKEEKTAVLITQKRSVLTSYIHTIFESYCSFNFKHIDYYSW